MTSPVPDMYTALRYPATRGEILVNSELQEYLVTHKANLDAFIASSVRLKGDKARDILVGCLPCGAKILCKVHKERGLMARLRCLLFASRAERGHLKTKCLAQLGYNTPVTFGFIVRGMMSRHCESIHFTQFIESAKTLENLSNEQALDDEALLTHLANLFFRLHQDGYIHGDAKLSNLLLIDNAVYFIDLDGFKRISSRWIPARDIARLLVGLSEQGCSKKGMLTLFDHYCRLAGKSGTSFKAQVVPMIEKFQQKHKRKYGLEPKEIL